MRFIKFIITITFTFLLINLVNAKEIKMGKADWDTGYFQAEVYKKWATKLLVLPL
jgi:hypothetical protein